MNEAGTRVVIVATKSPWPAVGGGNVTLDALIRALMNSGVSVHVVAPGATASAVPGAPYAVERIAVRPRSWLAAAPGALLGAPVSLRRFELRPLATAVVGSLAREPADVVHLEQLHLAWMIPILRHRATVVLRQQNVESVLLTRLAAVSRLPLRWLLQREAARVRRIERRACEMADAVAAISEVDAAALRALAPAASVEVLPAAWPVRAVRVPPPLPGHPAFVCLGSFDWRPNRDGAVWLLNRVWPRIVAARPEATLHLAGPGSASLGVPACGGVIRHGVVKDASSLLDPRAVLLVPVRAGSGVRLRVLEAWQAEVPAVTTPVGAEGLAAESGDGVLIAAGEDEFARAALSLAGEDHLRAALTARGRERLSAHRDDIVAATAETIYAGAVTRARRRGLGPN